MKVGRISHDQHNVLAQCDFAQHDSFLINLYNIHFISEVLVMLLFTF